MGIVVFWTFSLLLALRGLQCAKILTVCLIGGSHYLLLDEISQNLQQHGHEVRMLLQLGNPILTGFSYTGRLNSYQTSTWSLGEKYIQQYNEWFQEQQTQFLMGREDFTGFLNFMGHLSYQCGRLLGDTKIMSFLHKQHFDVAVLDAFNPCSFILARKLGIQYIAFYPGALNGPLSIALPSPVSYVPVFNSQLTDHMNLWGRMKNLFYSLLAPVDQCFIVVTLGSMVSSVSVHLLITELVAGFSNISYGVIWRYDTKKWPSHVDIPVNVKIVDWLPLNDLLGHPKACLFITHGGQNSLLQAVYHAVPILGILCLEIMHSTSHTLCLQLRGLSCGWITSSKVEVDCI
ncbi:hypothetical protein WMY93_004421 [Mugilogobius chulae]|uniref:glucuronosyltransferase n=1 Tax=Mugilogobius chulae TaxID=88201 RepID=A0AAW0PUT8_9GOBI